MYIKQLSEIINDYIIYLVLLNDVSDAFEYINNYRQKYFRFDHSLNRYFTVFQPYNDNPWGAPHCVPFRSVPQNTNSRYLRINILKFIMYFHTLSSFKDK